jgi:hypothetical protein
MTTSIIGSMEFSCKQSTLHHLQLRKGAMGRSSSGAAVGVAEVQQVSGAWRFDSFLTLLSPQLNPYCS